MLATAAALALMAGTAAAATLTIGRSAEQSAMDPQFSRTGNNQMTSQDIFDRLISSGPQLQMEPGLALSWRNLDPLTWELKLRDGVTFHDGSPFTVDDVIYSLERVKDVPNSPAPYTDMVSSVAGLEAVDRLTLRVKTKVPTPTIMEDIGRVFIVSKAATQGKSLKDFNSGAATIGTGPYKFERWTPGEQLVLVRNDAYWGPKPDYDKAVVRFIPNDAARLAAFLSGAVDLIDAVSANDLANLKASTKVNLVSVDSGRLIYLALNLRDAPQPFLVDAQGQTLAKNPLQDVRVRKAISKLINRNLIITRLINGAGTAAGQLVPKGIGGYAEDLKPDAPDVEGAKALLKEAGYPFGFGITVHSSNDRFVGDSEVAQAIGQMLARGGIKVNGVVAQPYNVYAGKASAGDFSAFVFSLGTSTPSAMPNLTSLLQTYDKATGTGAFNRIRYSNPAFDKALFDALREFDEAKRNEMLAAATRIAFEDQAVVPLYWQQVSWAMRKGITYEGTLAEYTMAKSAGIAR